MVCLLNGWSILLLLLLVLRFAKGRVDRPFYLNMRYIIRQTRIHLMMVYAITLHSCVHCACA